VTIEVKPVLDDVEYEGIELTRTKYEISDEEIDSQIHMIQKTMAKKETVTEERPVKEDDFVLIDYEGFLDNEPCKQTPKVENYVMGIGKPGMPKEFSKKLIGSIPVQDLEIEVPYSDGYHVDELKGKTIVYKVKLKEIQEEILPEADDDLAKSLGGQYESLEAVRTSIRENLEKGYEQRIKHELSEQIFQTLLEKCKFDIPEAMIESELDGIAREAQQAYTANNTSLEEVGLTEDNIRIQYRDVAEKQASRHLILDKIISQAKLELTEEEIEKGYEEMAGAMNASVDAIKNFFKMDARQFDYYKQTQLEKKAVELIIERGSVTEVEPEIDQTTDNSDEQKETAGTADVSGQNGQQ
jgi:trigger factor